MIVLPKSVKIPFLIIVFIDLETSSIYIGWNLNSPFPNNGINKEILNKITIVRSKGLKNEIAGYITNFIKKQIKLKEGKQDSDPEENEVTVSEPEEKEATVSDESN